MPVADDLAFDIEFALRRRPIGREARTALHGLSDADIEHMCKVVADHLRLSRWQRPPAAPTGPSPAWMRGPVKE